MKKALQGLLLWCYRLVAASGLLRTAAGRRLFQLSYGVYKQRLEARQVLQLRRLLPPGTTAIDVGANIGFFTRYFAAWVTPPGRVIAIEPDHDNVAQLKRMLQRAGLAERVKVLEGAAAERSGTLYLARNPNHPGDHRLAESGVPVKAYSLDRLLEQYPQAPVSLIKIDVQGAEVRVLRGAHRTLERWRPALYLEIDDQSLAASSSSAQALLDELDGLGYRCFDLADEALLQPLDRAMIAQRRAALGYGDFLFVATAAASG